MGGYLAVLFEIGSPATTKGERGRERERERERERKREREKRKEGT